MRTTQLTGLMMLQHKSATVDGDYLAIALEDGYIEASYNLGKQSANNLHIIRSNVKVNDGDWHTVGFKR